MAITSVLSLIRSAFEAQARHAELAATCCPATRYVRRCLKVGDSSWRHLKCSCNTKATTRGQHDPG